jgi:type III restriction enzyme
MSYTLRDYQRDAARNVLGKIRRGLRDHREEDVKSSFSLSALTGAGKTVIAAAVIEAMLHGSADLDFEPLPHTAFLWVTDDPALNQQTLDRMLQASDLLAAGQLVIIDEGFDQRHFDPGTVYFLNIQKLGKNTGFVRSGTDVRRFSIWEAVANTVSHHSTDLVLVLDEAHKGMRPQKDKKTLVRRLIDGPPAVPVVWGISATVQRFEEAMVDTEGRDKMSPIVIPIDLIRASGLVKDEVVLANPDEEGKFHTTMLRAAVGDTLQMEALWRAYTEPNKLPEVLPILIVQVPDKATDALLAERLQVITEEWPDLPSDAVVNVFGEHTHLELGNRLVKYLSPERIQDEKRVRIVLAKEAISSGWDCPRAEVLFSERPHEDDTPIAQIIGRIVRTPLAYRPVGDERLSQVFCYLPRFNREAVDKVVDRLRSGDDAITIDPVRETASFPRVRELEEAGVVELLETMPCEPAPQSLADPVRRAVTLATHLAGDGIVEGAGAQLRARLFARLDGLASEYAVQVETNRQDIFAADLELTTVDYAGMGAATRTKSSRRTDAVNVEDAYKATERRIKEGIVRGYYGQLVDRGGADVDLVELKADIAALLMIDGVVQQVLDTADEWTLSMLEQHHVAIRDLTDDRQADYRAVRAQSSKVEMVLLALPEVVTATTKDTKDQVVPRYEGHVFAGEDKKFPAKLNDWEKEVLATERKRSNFVAWYRNPPTARDSALRIAYLSETTGKWASLQPDFLFISRKTDGSLAASVIDPHGDYLADARAKLVALADYAEKYGDQVHRIESLTKVGGELRVLDLTVPAVRDAVRRFKDAKVTPLYTGEHSMTYT